MGRKSEESNITRYFITDYTEVETVESKRFGDIKLCFGNAVLHKKECYFEISINNVEDADELIMHLVSIKKRLLKKLMEG